MNEQSPQSFFNRQLGIANVTNSLPPVRTVLLVSVTCLMLYGLLMVASASIPFAKASTPLEYVQKQALFVGLGVFVAYIVSLIPLRFIISPRFIFFMLLTCGVLLVLTLFFEPYKGSSRWLPLGPVKFQTSEIVKLVMVIFTAEYVVRRSDEVRMAWRGFLRLCVIMAVAILLIMLQPDLGASVVIATSMMSVFFLAGAPIRQFIVLTLIGIGMIGVAIVVEPYRLVRLKSFADPFDDLLGTDLQQGNSIVAFARGQITGVGYGHSVFKLLHIPEAHTDFILAIVGEELGFIGVFVMLLLEACVIGAAMRIGFNALKQKHQRIGYLAYGIASILLLQVMINAGMNMGLIPPKGLTLPFVSYGGSSLVVCFMMVGLLWRIDKETRMIPINKSRYY